MPAAPDEYNQSEIARALGAAVAELRRGIAEKAPEGWFTVGEIVRANQEDGGAIMSDDTLRRRLKAKIKLGEWQVRTYRNRSNNRPCPHYRYTAQTRKSNRKRANAAA